MDDLLGEIRKNAAAGERVLVTTLTKRMAEDLTEHYEGQGVRVRYLHSDIDTMERVEILRDLRLGTFDVLVGINLLREGLDLPEVSLVAILDADKEGFLRSARSLVQTFGRAARNVSGRVILYADRETGSMREAMSETGRRRERQVAYNRENGITPETIRKMIADPIGQACEADYVTRSAEEPGFSSREECSRSSSGSSGRRWSGRRKNSTSNARRSCATASSPSRRRSCRPVESPFHKYGNVDVGRSGGFHEAASGAKRPLLRIHAPAALGRPWPSEMKCRERAEAQAKGHRTVGRSRHPWLPRHLPVHGRRRW